MKKLVLLVFTLGIIFQASNAQSPVNLGIKAGLNSSKLTTNLDDYDEKNINNFLAGMFLRVNAGKFYLQPEAYFNSKGGDLKNIEGTNSFDLKAIDVPILLGYKIIDVGAFNARLNTGPVFSFFTSKDVNNGSSFDPKNFKDNIFGWQYGAGVDFMFLSLDVRMENSFGDIYSGSSDEKIKSFLVTLGFKLF